MRNLICILTLSICSSFTGCSTQATGSNGNDSVAVALSDSLHSDSGDSIMMELSANRFKAPVDTIVSAKIVNNTKCSSISLKGKRVVEKKIGEKLDTLWTQGKEQGRSVVFSHPVGGEYWQRRKLWHKYSSAKRGLRERFLSWRIPLGQGDRNKWQGKTLRLFSLYGLLKTRGEKAFHLLSEYKCWSNLCNCVAEIIAVPLQTRKCEDWLHSTLLKQARLCSRLNNHCGRK